MRARAYPIRRTHGNHFQMNDHFADHFSPVSGDYARYRPTYPVALFAWLAKQVTSHNLAWDCAAGSGQASRDLTRYFKRIIATDASSAQIAAAAPYPGTEYRVAPAEASGLSEASVDLITVAQAMHWFDLDRFYAEARRVLYSKNADGKTSRPHQNFRVFLTSSPLRPRPRRRPSPGCRS